MPVLAITGTNKINGMSEQLTLFASRPLRWLVAAAVVAAFLYFLPLFHVVPLEETKEQAASAEFDPVAYVESFWQGPLLESAASATDAAQLLAAFEQDFAAAAERFGHRLGLGNRASYFVSGQGTVLAVEDKNISIALREGGPTQVVIRLGPLFSNAVRDGSGLLDVSDFENVQDFNAISAEINRRIEEQLFPFLRENAAVGKAVKFAGGVEVADSAGAPSSLNLVPVIIEFP